MLNEMNSRSPLVLFSISSAAVRQAFGFLAKCAVWWVFLQKALVFAGPESWRATSQAEEWVTVGNPGNPSDVTGHGSVRHVFEIGKCEVTVGQWVEFLNAVARTDPHRLWKSEMADAGLVETHTRIIERRGESGAFEYRAFPGTERFPVVFVNLTDAMRFANWLHNGCGAGDTESGAYDLKQAGMPRSPTARYWVPTEDEWYKAAYHQPEAQQGPAGGYWMYPTRSQEPPLLERQGGSGVSSASFLDPKFPGSNYASLNPVGSHPFSSSYYGTLDQGGSVWEWTETPVRGTQRILRGGSVTKPVAALRSVMRFGCEPRIPQRDFGFRLARAVGGVGGERGAGVAAGAKERAWLLEARQLFEESCMDCHEAGTRKGGLDLEELAWEPNDVENQRIWTRIYDRVLQGEMPPRSKPRPGEALVTRFTKELQVVLHQESLRRQRTDGRVVARRLNRREYIQVVRDLFDFHGSLEDLLPQDALAHGFDTVGSALQLSGVHLERYMEAADRVVQEAGVLRGRPEARVMEMDLSQVWLTKAERAQNGWSYSPEGYLAIRALRGNGGRNLDWRAEVPNALYRFTVRTRAMLDDAEEGGGGGKAKDRTSPEIRGQAGLRIFNLWPKGGTDPRMTVAIGLAPQGALGGLEGASFFEASPVEFRDLVYAAHVPAGYTLQIAPYRIIPEEHGEEGGKFHGMCAVVESVKIEGPIFEEWPTRGRRLMYGDLATGQAKGKPGKPALELLTSDPETDARRILEAALPRLYRHPLEQEELEEAMDHFRSRLRAGAMVHEALQETFKMALCSPEFLFLREKAGPLDGYARAARMALGLWGTVPDARLIQSAEKGGLNQPETLRQETDRLLNDPKVGRFARNFLGNWLNLREINATQPDTKLFTEYEAQLQDSMVAESEAFWLTLIRDDLPVSTVVHSDFAMLNERLAEHYGIAGVRGTHIRKVMLPEGSRRGGFLTQGAVLKVSANGTVTSPVIRGAYVLDRFLGRPPEPPPKSVPAIEPDIRGASTIREQLERHRKDAACALCHARIDPPGFALESYDVTGRWRTEYRVLAEENRDKTVTLPGAPYRLFLNGPKVHPEGRMEDGFCFEDIDGFKQRLLAEPEVLARCLVQKLTVHLTGAAPQFADREVVDAILKQAEPSGYGIRDLIHGIIQSRLFTHK